MSCVPTQSVLVYDVGGSHVSASLCSTDRFRLGPVASAPYPDEQNLDAFLDFLVQLAHQATPSGQQACGVEVAMPGPFDYANGISQMTHKLGFLFGVDLRAMLAERLDLAAGSIRFLNDAASYLLGEVGAGQAQNAARAVALTLGTGIGSAFAVDGQIVTTGAGVPAGGEIWNLPYQGGILEDALSTRALQAAYQKRTGKTLKVYEIAHLAPTDGDAVAVFAEFGQHIGEALRTIVGEFRPEVVVLGGGIARSAHLFLPAAEAEIAGMGCQIKITELFDNAPLVGAAVAWQRAQSR